MAKKVFVIITIILLFLGGVFYFFPCSAKVESVRVANLNKDNEALVYRLKEAKWNFKPEKKYLYLTYTVSIQPHLPLRFHFANITFQQLRDDFKVILVEPGIPHQEGGLFKEKHEYFNVLVECPNDMNPEVIINNTNFELHAYRLVINPEWKKHPEHTTYYLSYPSWPDVKVKVTKDMIIEIEH
jgi:hypothetical protein